MNRQFIISLCCVLVPTPFTGLASDTQTQPKIIEKKEEHADIGVLVSMPEQSISGSTVTLTIKVENRSKKDVFFTSRTKYSDYDLQVIDPKGKPARLTRFGKYVHEKASKEASGKNVTLAPGKHIQVTLNLARIYDLTYIGQYTLRVSLQVCDEAGKSIQLRVENLKVKILSDTPGGL